MIIIGLTGNIACGKSMVARMLCQLGAEVLDADKVVHELMADSAEIRERIAAAFGDGVITPSGEIDRMKLGGIVFADQAALARLESIIHPAVRERIEQAIRTSKAPAIVIEAIKLIESEMHQRCDSVWVVACRPEQQLDRMVKDRGLSPEAASIRIKAQPPAADKLRFADVIIDNCGTLEQTWEQVREAWRQVVQMPDTTENRKDP